MKKTFAIFLSFLLMLSLFAGCQQDKPQQKQITIPAITVDLQAPENRVNVPAEESSTVYDRNGNALTDSQWLLNSKFAKQYIKSLGVGEYEFRYESASATGTIYLTITDSQAPDYLFTGEIPGTVNFRDSVVLPELVKNQDSYQADCEVSYTLKKGEETIAIEEFTTPALLEGDYTWIASAVKDGTSYEFTQSFHVQTFEEYLSGMENTMLLDMQTSQYVAGQQGVYTVDTSENTLDYFYKVNPEVVATAITAGKTTATIHIAVDEPLAYGDNGSIWLSNNWNGYVFAVEGKTPFTTDRSDPSWPNRFTNSMVIENGKYIYTGTVFLDPVTFTEAQPLTLQFNYAQCVAEITVEFE